MMDELLGSQQIDWKFLHLDSHIAKEFGNVESEKQDHNSTQCLELKNGPNSLSVCSIARWNAFLIADL